MLFQDDPPSPVKRPIHHAPRPDAEPHFKLRDDESPMPANDRAATAISKSSSARADNDRAHYSIQDNSPAYSDPNKTKKGTNYRTEIDANWGYETPLKEKAIYKTAGDGMGGRRDAGGPIWGSMEDTPEAKGKAIYKTAGNGMGGRRDAAPIWGIGESSA
jgi:hypothetical protein